MRTNVTWIVDRDRGVGQLHVGALKGGRRLICTSVLRFCPKRVGEWERTLLVCQLRNWEADAKIQSPWTEGPGWKHGKPGSPVVRPWRLSSEAALALGPRSCALCTGRVQKAGSHAPSNEAPSGIAYPIKRRSRSMVSGSSGTLLRASSIGSSAGSISGSDR